MTEAFDKQRENCFSGVDLSRKGSVDAPIVSLVNLINQQDNYFTTSSCSGRIIVFEQTDGNQVKKKGCKWLLTSHDVIKDGDVVNSLSQLDDDAVFKFEPLVLHVQCRSLEDAQRLHACAVASGFRNSGITVGSKGKIITAVRSTHSLEVPLSKGKTILVSNEYLAFLTDCANSKMKENFTRIQRFHENFKAMLFKPKCDTSKRKKKETNEHRQKTSANQDGDDHEKGDNCDIPRGDQSNRARLDHSSDSDIDTNLLFDDT